MRRGRYDDAQVLLQRIIDEELFIPRGTAELFPRQLDW